MSNNKSTTQLVDNVLAGHPSVAFDMENIERAVAEKDAEYSGLGIKLLSIAGGVFGSVFLMVCIALLSYGNAGVLIFLGATALIATCILERNANSTLLDTISICTYLGGLAMISTGLSDLKVDEIPIIITLAAIACLTLVFTAGFMLNFFAVMIFSGSLFALILTQKVNELVVIPGILLAVGYTLISINEAALITFKNGFNIRFNAIKNGLLFSFTGALLFLAAGYPKITTGYILGIAIFLMIGYLLHYLIAYHKIKELKIRLLIYCSLLILMPVITSPTICGAVLILLVSFHTGHKTGIAIAILALFYFVGKYYYDLQYTLLVKSEILMATGLLFLIAWVVVKKQLIGDEKN